MWKFQGLIKKKWIFRSVQEKLMWNIHDFDLGISKGYHAILQSFRGWKLVFYGISKGKVANLEIPGVFPESISCGITHWPYVKTGYLYHFMYSIYLFILMCSFFCAMYSLSSVSGMFMYLYCDTGLLERSTPYIGGKTPPLLLHWKYICCKDIIEDRGKIPSLLAFYELFLSYIKVKILISS